MSQTLLEIERKYLIKHPDTRALAELSGVHMSTIVQTYLCPETHPHARVRARTENGHTVYTHTVKTPVSAITRIEDEHEISFEEYEALLAHADKNSATIYKTRYNLPFEGFVFEIDIYPFWDDVAVMEIELPSEDKTFTFPDGIEVIREITDEKAFSNRSLAKWQGGNAPAPVLK